MIRALLVRSNESPFKFDINRNFTEIEKFIHIPLTIADINEKVMIICMDHTAIYGSRLNRQVGTHLIYGPFVIVGLDANGVFCSLTESQIKILKLMLTIEYQNEEELEYEKVRN